MRFYADGPSIPADLLEARDNGEVVFFCGAGVSMPAGLPSFFKLVQDVITEFGVPNDSLSRRLLERALKERELAVPLDQVMSTLQRAYGVPQIERFVCRRLRTPRKANLSCHKIVLRLSTDAAGRARLVTTNFDLLFEAAKPKLNYYAPPILPDLSQEQPFDGLVYLHGRLRSQRSDAINQGLILGSGDFGRAYLSEGWASQFLRALLSRYTVVLLGYSADDPPIRYLLEGINSQQLARSQRIYAFAEGRPGETEERWWDRGVRSIQYVKKDVKHSGLWETLSAWADRADNASAWRQDMVELARRRPIQLLPHERGQVAALIRSPLGAKALADAVPPPPAEWLCVFDAGLRYAKPQQGFLQNESDVFDPLTAYGLDDDPPRGLEVKGQPEQRGADLLLPLSADERGPNHVCLGGVFAGRSDPLPPRIRHLARWISNVAHQSASPWWAAQQSGLHDTLQQLIESAVDRPSVVMSKAVRQAWMLIFESTEQRPEPLKKSWHDLQPRLKRDGWTSQTLREFSRIARPLLKIEGSPLRQPRPSEKSDEELQLEDIANFEVEFPGRPHFQLEIGDNVLPNVVASIRRGLEEAATLLDEIREFGWRTTTLHPEQGVEGRYISEADATFLWFAELFDELCKRAPKLAYKELLAWPAAEPFFFDKLHIWAWMKVGIVPIGDAVEGLLNLSQGAFWNNYSQRELLWTLRGRWKEFTREFRQNIEDKIFGGPERWLEESLDHYNTRRASAAAVRLGWLQLNGCELSEVACERLVSLRTADSNWRETWDKSADHSFEGRTGWVKTETNPTSIVEAPVSEIVVRAQANSRRSADEFVEYDPFRGLVESRPTRALAGLSFEARNSRFPINFWETALSNWPDAAPSRATWIFAKRLSRLPKPVLLQLRHYMSRWLGKHLPRMTRDKRRDIWPIWDAAFEAIVDGGRRAAESALGEVTIGGVPQGRSRRTYSHAINSPIGNLTQCLVDVLSDLKPSRRSGIPDTVRHRMERAMDAPGEGGDNAVSILGLQFAWLDWIDPRWAEKTLLPMFAVESERAEPIWSGFLYSNMLPKPSLFKVMKPAFLSAFKQSIGWDWEDRASKRLSEFLVVATIRNDKKKQYISFEEARVALQSADDDARLSALYQLELFTRKTESWRSIAKPFLERAWPREIRFQTAETSAALVAIAANADEDFPDASRTVSPFIQPVVRPDVLVFRLREGKGDDVGPLAQRFPKEVLELLDRLIASNPPQMPYELGTVLEMIADKQPALRQDLRWRRLNDLWNG